jgi:hypothetical protein
VVAEVLVAQEDLVVLQTEVLVAQEDLVAMVALQETEALVALPVVVIAVLMVKEIFLELAALEVLEAPQMAVTVAKRPEVLEAPQMVESVVLVVTVVRQMVALAAKVE